MSYNNNYGRYTMYRPYGSPVPSPASAPPTPVTKYNYTQPPQGCYAVTVVDMLPPTNKEITWSIGRTIKWIAIIDTFFSLIYSLIFWS